MNTCNTYMNFKEARELTDKINLSLAKGALQNIFLRIKKETEKGEEHILVAWDSVTDNSTMPTRQTIDLIKKELNNLGYSLNDVGPYLRIDW